MCFGFGAFGVSIPYRYATNRRSGGRVEAERKRFQFLIGTLQTDPGAIGPTGLKEFQFLIGTLQTADLSQGMATILIVSIPYRYATNASGRCP